MLSVAFWTARLLVAAPFLIAAALEGLSSPEALEAMDLIWIPGAPLWLVRALAVIEGLAALGLILPGLPWAGLSRLSLRLVTLSATVLLVIQMAAIGIEVAASSTGDLAVKAVVLALTLFILWVRLRHGQAEIGRKASPTPPIPKP